MTSKFDYIIAGGGSAGCALAYRLAKNSSASVCLVEAGGHGRDLFIKMPAGNGFVFGNPKLDWGYSSIPQKELNDRQIYFARGKALGGSSIVNGMIYMRGIASDYDHWRQMGLNGWSYSDLLPYFIRSEGSLNRKDQYHGNNGPLKVEPARNFGKLDKAFIKAALQSGHNFLEDFNGPVRTGVSRVDSTVHKGIRQSSALAYLKKVPKNLHIFTNTHISRILFEQTRAVGIESVKGDKFFSDREIIICQGAFGTPQLLMLSGIGPSDHLLSHGIKPIMDLQGVGQNLADHIDVSMQYGSRSMDLSAAKYQRLDKAALLMGKWLLNGSGPGGGSLFSTVLFHALEDPNMPELQVYMTPMIFDENFENGESESVPFFQRLGRKLLIRGRKVAKPGIQIDINQERPKSFGSVRLLSADPLKHPRIDPNYLNDFRDLEELIKGVKAMREVMAQPEISQYLTGEKGVWANANTENEIISAIRETAYTGHHPCSTARMGVNSDVNAVLDEKLKVRGIEGLRVCDASAMPTQITGNLYATVIAMAEKAADMILGFTPLSSKNLKDL